MSEKIQILVADDDRNIAQLLRTILEPEGYEVTVAHDGEAALEARRARKFDLVILDVNMPAKDGLAACEEIRREDPNVLILFLTAQKAQVNLVTGLTAGADGYMTKPFGARELLARVKSLLRRLDRP
jgi:DNA-binding response OmpR family regulator